MADPKSTDATLKQVAADSMAVQTCCLWCGERLTPRRGGSPKRFCCARHRLMFWNAARRWAERAVTAGILTVGDPKKGAPAASALLLMGSRSLDALEAPEAAMGTYARRSDSQRQVNPACSGSNGDLEHPQN